MSRNALLCCAVFSGVEPLLALLYGLEGYKYFESPVFADQTFKNWSKKICRGCDLAPVDSFQNLVLSQQLVARNLQVSKNAKSTP